jgi:hypothetical protein
MESLTTSGNEEEAQMLLGRAIDLDQLIVLEVECLIRDLPLSSELAATLNSVLARTMENGRVLHEIQRSLRPRNRERLIVGR